MMKGRPPSRFSLQQGGLNKIRHGKSFLVAGFVSCFDIVIYVVKVRELFARLSALSGARNGGHASIYTSVDDSQGVKRWLEKKLPCRWLGDKRP